MSRVCHGPLRAKHTYNGGPALEHSHPAHQAVSYIESSYICCKVTFDLVMPLGRVCQPTLTDKLITQIDYTLIIVNVEAHATPLLQFSLEAVHFTRYMLSSYYNTIDQSPHIDKVYRVKYILIFLAEPYKGNFVSSRLISR